MLDHTKRRLPPDLLKNRYAVSRENTVWCIDGTFIHSGVVLAIIDLSTRQTLGHSYIPGVSGNGFKVAHVTALVDEVLNSRGNPKEIILHSDRGGQFQSDEYLDFCFNRNVNASMPESSFGNQAMERWNGSFKKTLLYLLKLRLDKLSENKIDLKSLCTLGFLEVRDLVHKAVELYNQKPHRANFLLSPNHIDTALRSSEPSQSKDVALLSESDGEDAVAINSFRSLVVEQYAGNWARFFLSWREQQSREYEEARKDRERLFQVNIELRDQNEELRKNVALLVEAMKRAEAEKAEREEKRQKRKEVKHQKPRDCISPEVFSAALEQYEEHSLLVKARSRVAMTFLYLTGLRVSNLLSFTVGLCKKFINKEPILIPLLKGGGKKTLRVPSYATTLIRNITKDLELLYLGKSMEDPLFHSKNNITQCISRQTFTMQINAALRAVSKDFNLNLKSHSFRISLVTDLLRQSVPLQDVSSIIGHTSISTTAKYSREYITPEKAQMALSAVVLSRKKAEASAKSKRNRQLKRKENS